MSKETPQEIADECFDIYLTEMGIVMKERRLIISYANKRVKKACKEQSIIVPTERIMKDMASEFYPKNYVSRSAFIKGQYSLLALIQKANAPEPL